MREREERRESSKLNILKKKKRKKALKHAYRTETANPRNPYKKIEGKERRKGRERGK